MNFRQRRGQPVEQSRPRLGRRDRPDGARQQPHAETVFQPPHRVAERRGRYPQFRRRGGEAAGPGDGSEGADEPTARAIFDTYVEAGGNLIDTADVYSGGESEKMLGRILKDSWMRDTLVVSTKAGFSRSEGTPMHAGNGAYNIRLGIEGSLKLLAWIGSTFTGCMSGTS